MVTSVQRWGNSLAIRIPKPFASQVKLSEDSEVDISMNGDTIVITPARRKWKLDELVSRITPDNRHSEVEIGSRSGKEAW